MFTVVQNRFYISMALLIMGLLVNCFARAGASFALDLKTGSESSYVSLGDTSHLGLSRFTLELWFKRTGDGESVNTGGGGTNAIPLIAKGRNGSDGTNRDLNYFLGINGNDFLVVDFEDIVSDENSHCHIDENESGNNNPVVGITTVTRDVWHHAAVTYDGSSLRLYLNGEFENGIVIGKQPRWDSIQHTALGTTLNSSGVAKGHFDGLIDEVRIWKVARNEDQINATKDIEINDSKALPELVARWGFNEPNEPNEIVIEDTTPNAIDGDWVNGSPHAVSNNDIPALSSNTPPNQPTLISSTGDELSVNVSDNDGDELGVSFQRRRMGTALSLDNTYLSSVNASEGSESYVTVPHHSDPNSEPLGLEKFTLELWFMQLSPGSAANTGAGGVSAIPLITKGRAEADGGSSDMNYFLGIRSSNNVLVADFEEGPGLNAGQNHPIIGETVIEYGVWNHAAVTYDGVDFKLYLNGQLEKELLNINKTPKANSVQPFGLGTAFNSQSETGGNFDGLMDEVRVWNYARSASQIENNFDQEITDNSIVVGLISRWSMNEPLTNSSTLINSQNRSLDGKINGTRWHWSRQREPEYVLALAGDSYVTLIDDPTDLGLSEFTLELWFNQAGKGEFTLTGAGGVNAAPLISKGRGESDGTNRDMNYFLGIDANGKLVADFEEGDTSPSPGQNHPISGQTVVQTGEWNHAAVTYGIDNNGVGKFTLYLNGEIEDSLEFIDSAPTPRFDSIQHFGIGSAINSNGVPDGFFNGHIDEVRIWDYARTKNEIKTSKDIDITAENGLIARWGMDISRGNLIRETVGNNMDGTVINMDNNEEESDAGWGWVSKSNNLKPDFTIIAIPDTQYYSDNEADPDETHFKEQTTWIHDNKDLLNISFVAHLGDIVEDGNGDASNNYNMAEWEHANDAMGVLEAAPSSNYVDGIPYGLAVGNHDQGEGDGSNNDTGDTFMFNNYFCVNRFEGRSYYGGHYQPNNDYSTDIKNDNNFELFSAGGMDFIVINIEYIESGLITDQFPAIIWADNLLKTYANRQAIVVSHSVLHYSFSERTTKFNTQGKYIYKALNGNPNLFMILTGHHPAEGRRRDTFKGSTVHTLLSDYQFRPNGGDGWLRIMEFHLARNEIHVKTYSPTLDRYEYDGDSDFIIPLDFVNIETLSDIATGSTVSTTMNNYIEGAIYQWYVIVSDSIHEITGGVWDFLNSN